MIVFDSFQGFLFLTINNVFKILQTFKKKSFSFKLKKKEKKDFFATVITIITITVIMTILFFLIL